MMGTEVCSFKTIELEYVQSNDQLGTHMKLAHNEGLGPPKNEKNKPEKFPRPSIEADSTTEIGKILRRPGISTRRNTISLGRD